jgi:glycerophosphoryl diester phosphodiesterase
MVEIFAHRGLHEVERENTLAAFRAAVALGVDGVELDVRATLDRALVVHHEPAVAGLVVAETLREALPDYVATLEEALGALETVWVNVEIKNIRHPSEPSYDDTGDFARQVVDLIHRVAASPFVIISCFDLPTCVVVRHLDPTIRVGWLTWDVDPLDALVSAHEAGLSALNPHFGAVTGEVVARADLLGLDLNVWTVNRPADLRAMAELGVCSVITDDPALARELLG